MRIYEKHPTILSIATVCGLSVTTIILVVLISKQVNHYRKVAI